MDFAINLNAGLPEMTWDRSDGTIFNNIYLSLMIPRGGWWFNPEFGSRLHELGREKLTPRTERLARDYTREALQWLIDAGRATAVAIDTEIDRTQTTGRLKLIIAVTQADNRTVTFDTFVGVV